MNTKKKLIDIALEKISFIIIQKYLSNKGWISIPSKRDYVSIWQFGNPVQIEIILPLDRELVDYNDSIIRALYNISQSEKREIEEVINDLLLPPSDIIKISASNKRTEDGLIPISEGFSLFENAKKLLFAAACDVSNPSFYHKRMSYKIAQQFIDSCFLGQTERGSFTASVICPFIKETIDESPAQLSFFHSDDDLVDSFSRKVTKKVMGSLYRMKDIIKTGKHELFEDIMDDNKISGNFIESILALGKYEDNEKIEISASWSPILRKEIDVPQTISFTKDYIYPMESIVSKLKPKYKGSYDEFIGKISKARANPDINNRNNGEITFNFIGNSNKVISATVILTLEDFSNACKALEKGLNVKISGNLIQQGKNKSIDNPIFELL